MDQDATWYGGMPRPRPWGPSSSLKKGAQPLLLFSADVHCGEVVGWIWIPLGTGGLSPGDIVLEGDLAPPTERGTAAAPSQFSAHVYCGQTVTHLSNC